MMNYDGATIDTVKWVVPYRGKSSDNLCQAVTPHISYSDPISCRIV